MKLPNKNIRQIPQSEVFDVARIAVPDAELLKTNILAATEGLSQQSASEPDSQSLGRKKPRWVVNPWWVFPATASVAIFMVVAMLSNTPLPSQTEGVLEYEDLYSVNEPSQLVDELAWQDMMLMQDELALLDF